MKNKINIFLYMIMFSGFYNLCSQYTDEDRKGEFFLIAVNTGELNQVKEMLNQKHSPLYTGSYPTLDNSIYGTALFFAASNKDDKMLDLLLKNELVKKSNMINISTGKVFLDNQWKSVKNINYGSPLSVAISDTRYKYSKYGTGFHSGYLDKRLLKKQVDSVKLLLQQDNINLVSTPNVLSQSIYDGKSNKYQIFKMILKKSIDNGQVGLLINYLPESSYLIESLKFNIPLISAIEYAAPLDIIELLLKNGASPKAKGKDNKSALEIVKNKLEELNNKVKNKELSKVDYIANKLGINIGVPGEIKKFEKILKLLEAKIKEEEK